MQLPLKLDNFKQECQGTMANPGTRVLFVP